MKLFDTRLILKNSIESIQKLLRDAFKPEKLDITDESAQHAHHSGMYGNTELLTHIYIRIKATELLGLSRVNQHRKIYAVLQPAIDNGLHAVRIEVI